MKIMLVEDDYLLNKAIKNYFKHMNIDSFLDGESAYQNISNNYDIFIIDIDVPEINGIELLIKIRELYKTAYIIMISATIEIGIIEKAYSLGCNDYMKKPFEIKELELKLNLIENKISNKYKILDDLFYNSNKSQLFYKEEIINLTAKETKLLYLLINNKGKIVTSEMILNYIWEDITATDQTRQLVSRLKKKIPIDFIQNRQGQGYIIE